MSAGRPKSPIQATDPSVRIFFEEIDSMGISLKDLTNFLKSIKGNTSPSYRTLQEWRRGNHIPHYAPLDTWLSAVRIEFSDRKH